MFAAGVLHCGSGRADIKYHPPSSYWDHRVNSEVDDAAVERVISESGAETVEGALVALKAAYPELFEKYLLMYRSRSLQASSFKHPRAILLNKDGTLAVSFNGDPKHRGFHNLEVRHFKKAGARFEYREVTFRPGQKPHFSNPNPAKCLQCHQSVRRANIDPRPNWEPYSLWPGAYGSNSELRYHNPSSLDYDNRLRYDPKTGQGEDAPLLADFRREKIEFDNFWENVRPGHERYALLGPFPEKMTVDYTDRTATLNFQRVIRMVRDLSHVYPWYRYAFAAIGQCGYIPWPEVFEETHAARLPRQERLAPLRYTPFTREQAILGMMAEGNLSYEEIQAMLNAPPPPPPRFERRPISVLINLMFEPLGIETADWSTDFKSEGGRFAFYERFGTPSDPAQNFRLALALVEPELSRMGCTELTERSLAALEDFRARGGLDEARIWLDQRLARRDPPLVERCISCHVTDRMGYIPWIPFDDPVLLRRELVRTGYPRGTLADEIIYRVGPHANLDEAMPLNAPVTEDQRRTLVEFIRGL